MSDQIVGISVLQPTWVPGIYRLWFDCLKGADGTKAQCRIFMKEATSVGLPDKIDYPDGCSPIWKFTRNGGKLDCTPSVNWISWGFHNAGAWSTDFVEMTEAEKSESAAGPEPTRYERGSAVHYDLNRTTGLDQSAMVTELRQQGVLRP